MKILNRIRNFFMRDYIYSEVYEYIGSSSIGTSYKIEVYNGMYTVIAVDSYEYGGGEVDLGEFKTFKEAEEYLKENL